MEESMERVRRGARRSARRAGLTGLVVAAGAAVLLSACTSGAGGAGGPGSGILSKSPVANDKSPSTAGAPSTTVPTSAPAPEPAVITTSAGSRLISPSEPVNVSIEHGRLTDVTMTNPFGKKVSGELTDDGTSWRNTEDLGYSRTYTIVAKGVNAAGAPVSKTAKVTTLTPGNKTLPYIDDIYGSSVKQNGTYGIGMVVRVHFDEQVNEKLAEQTLHVTTTPEVTGGWYWADSQNAYWRPKDYYTPGTKVTVSAMVYGKKVGDGLYGQADRSVTFKIGAKHVSIADAKTHHVKVYWDDKLVRNMPTSMGQGGTVQGRNGPIYLWTMPGTYTVLGFENPAIMSSDSYGLPANSPYGYGPEKVYWSTKISTDGIYLHELDTTVWAQGHRNVSHGCLNLNQTNAKWFYQHSYVGDVVKVVNSGGPHIQFWQGGQWDVPWSKWLAGSALH
jgi:lipoprotein-anchoring transpeptidase ErfK/SrfK